MLGIESQKAESVRDLARRAKVAARKMARLATDDKNRALRAIAESIGRDQDLILAANHRDLESARTLVESGQMSEALYHRLKLDHAKLAGIIAGVSQVEALDDPVGRITLATELDEDLRLYRVSCPIGVIGVSFESRPDGLDQISTLAHTRGNAVPV